MTKTEARPNIHDKFDDVLMYTTGYSRLKIDHKVMEDREFRKTVKYMAKRFHSHNLALCMRTGYEKEDIETIFLMLGLVFMASNYEAKDSHTRYMFLMHYLQQKQGRTVSLLKRKHSVDDVRIFRLSDTRLESSHRFTPTHEEIPREPELMKKQVKARQVAASKRLNELVATKGSEIADQMAYYATIRCVGSDVRSRARSYCKQMGIDYTQWAKEYMTKHGFDIQEFIL
jgi:hypothetical protein